MADHPITHSNKPARSFLGTVGALIGLIISFAFLLNLSFGLLEIPDNLPILGNIDEVVASAFLLGCLRYLGIDLIPFKGKRTRTPEQLTVTRD